MPSDFDAYFNAPSKQKRSQERVEQILDSIEKIADEDPNWNQDIRSISKAAKVSTGALYHHFPSIAHLFASLFIHRVKRTHSKMITLINQLGPAVTLEELSNVLVDNTFIVWGRVNPSVRRIAIHFFYRNAKQPELLYSFIEPLIPHLKAFAERNTTNTLRDIPEEEWPLLLRTMQTAVSSPFIEQLAIAGSDAHRRFAKDSFRRLLAK